MMYGKQQQQQQTAVSLASMNPWMAMPVAPTAQHVVSHLPVFAAWADA
jgi:AP2-like factor (ANT lineage)